MQIYTIIYRVDNNYTVLFKNKNVALFSPNITVFDS